ncbi:hypothetical protein MOQ72_01410 [Saccharopolyspora sp. K220]|uniref:hypothetical protein n=1 Tax=Saccharopolyspora soli TaxID=2926618 RepID=UPI001F586157|nr:hypothetical protein [Saccharopolyspora soli]MCI2416068.1 hypothetical protein [Saccharopolyspora soli]
MRLRTSLGGAAPSGDAATRLTGVEARPGAVHARLAVNGPGEVHLFVLDADGVVLADQRIDVNSQADREVPIPVGSGVTSTATCLDRLRGPDFPHS